MKAGLEPVPHHVPGRLYCLSTRPLQRPDPDQREVLSLRLVAGLTVEQTAEATDESAGAVKQLQRRGAGSGGAGSTVAGVRPGKPEGRAARKIADE